MQATLISIVGYPYEDSLQREHQQQHFCPRTLRHKLYTAEEVASYDNR